jgi:hypothetical protein
LILIMWHNSFDVRNQKLYHSYYFSVYLNYMDKIRILLFRRFGWDLYCYDTFTVRKWTYYFIETTQPFLKIIHLLFIETN